MSLQTDIIFVKAISSNAALMAKLPAHGCYNTAIPVPKEGDANVKIPYVLVSYSGMENENRTKDSFEGQNDKVEIQVEIAARNRNELAELAETIRETIRDYFENADPRDEDFELIPEDYHLSASAVMLDDAKPCHWQILSYSCDTNI
jgi:hypothetical protein